MASNFDIGFDTDKFMALPPAERINACVALAKRAQELAAAAHVPYQAYYLRIASDWLSGGWSPSTRVGTTISGFSAR